MPPSTTSERSHGAGAALGPGAATALAATSGQPAPSPALAPPPGNPRFPLFDGLRGIAVIAVLSFHVSELTAKLGRGVGGRAAEVAGPEAVIVFFMISGFLLYRPYAAARADGRPAPPAGRYFRRRALRILPAYWTVLTLLAIFPGIVGVFSNDWWRYYGYLQVYSSRTAGLGIPVAWTLCVEVTFYLALPIWAAAIRRIPARRGAGGLLWTELAPLAGVALGGIAVQLAAARQLIPHETSSTLAGQCVWLALGMALAAVSVWVERDRRTVRWVSRFAARTEPYWLVAAAAFAGLMWLVPRGGVFGLIALDTTVSSARTALARIVLEAIVAALLLLPAIFAGSSRDGPRRLLASRPIVWLGVVSYSFYLWHLTVAELIAQGRNPVAFSARGLGLLSHVHSASWPILFVATFAASAVLASLSYRLVELPFLRRKER